MTDRPIIFSAPMVRALLREIEEPGAGKTQTRRILKPAPKQFDVDGGPCEVALEYMDGEPWPRIRLGLVITTQQVRYRPGMRLWVRETWGYPSGPGCYVVESNKPNAPGPKPGFWSHAYHRAGSDGMAWGMYGPPKWRPSIYMPRCASRITLMVEAVRVERLQDISEEDARAEGCAPWTGALQSYRTDFYHIWTHLHGPGSWDANPWVVAVTFRPVLGNIDELKE